jgi:hypothetical protein
MWSRYVAFIPWKYTNEAMVTTLFIPRSGQVIFQNFSMGTGEYNDISTIYRLRNLDPIVVNGEIRDSFKHKQQSVNIRKINGNLAATLIASDSEFGLLFANPRKVFSTYVVMPTNSYTSGDETAVTLGSYSETEEFIDYVQTIQLVIMNDVPGGRMTLANFVMTNVTEHNQFESIMPPSDRTNSVMRELDDVRTLIGLNRLSSNKSTEYFLLKAKLQNWGLVPVRVKKKKKKKAVAAKPRVPAKTLLPPKPTPSVVKPRHLTRQQVRAQLDILQRQYENRRGTGPQINGLITTLLANLDDGSAIELNALITKLNDLILADLHTTASGGGRGAPLSGEVAPVFEGVAARAARIARTTEKEVTPEDRMFIETYVNALMLRNDAPQMAYDHLVRQNYPVVIGGRNYYAQPLADDVHDGADAADAKEKEDDKEREEEQAKQKQADAKEKKAAKKREEEQAKQKQADAQEKEADRQREKELADEKKEAEELAASMEKMHLDETVTYGGDDIHPEPSAPSQKKADTASPELSAPTQDELWVSGMCTCTQ